MFVYTDPLTVLAAAVTGFVAVVLWYLAFGRLFAAPAAPEAEPAADARARATLRIAPIVVAALASLVTAYLLADLLAGLGADSATGGLVAAALLWAGFAATFLAIAMTFAGMPARRTIVDAAGALVSLCAMGWVIGAIPGRTPW